MNRRGFLRVLIGGVGSGVVALIPDKGMQETEPMVFGAESWQMTVSSPLAGVGQPVEDIEITVSGLKRK